MESTENLTEEQRNKLTQFKDLVGFEERKCLQILNAQDWNLEVALDLALDGAYNDDSIFDNSSPQSHRSESPSIRHRHTTSSSSQNSSQDVSVPSPTPPSEAQGLHVTLWNATAWIFKLPIMIIYNTFSTFYEFVVSMIRPTLNFDYTGTVERFISEFEVKYGRLHPNFFRGTYAQVLDQGKRDIRFALVYLHSASARDVDRFCSNVIATQRFKDFIDNENIIFWSCSVDYPDGYRASQALRANSYPFLGLIGLRGNRMALMKKFEGYKDLDQLLQLLKTAITNNEYSLIAARLRKEEQNMNSLIRAQQDAAFEESLKADQEKERKKREAEEKKANEERELREKEEAEERYRQRLVELKQTLKEIMPEEPPADGQDIFRLMFRLPAGKRIERRFHRHDPVKFLYYFVFCCEEDSLVNFKIRTNFPTRDLAGSSPTPDMNLDDQSPENEMNTSLEKCGLESNLVLFVHDLDS